MAQVRNNVEQQGVLPLDCPLRGEIRGERSIMDFPFFALEKNEQTMAALHEAGVHPQAAERVEGGPLAGRVFVFTGGLNTMSRDDAKEQVEALGAKAVTGVSKKVTDVVAGEDAGSKLAKAEKLGLRIHTEEEFQAILAKL